ncbi:MAG: hypothetical protein CMG06_06710 [Candidatus Marinimicrobia bacterium]|nr:hypothetical protein [Candidatus Neomarinimicrobiota bacterium]|tara:strand:- start:736 stop:4101 length:3366 start_codon:yes stop_codon:yes gene_type:complete
MDKMLRSIIVRETIFLISLISFASGQSDFSFKNISVSDGLAESTVKVIFEDKNGLMYIGTENGLDVYDGYEFNNYHMNSFDNNSILGNKVSCISEDSKNNIWVGTELGVSIFDIESRTFSRPINPNDIDNEILEDPETIIDDEQGNIWIKLSESGIIYKYSFSSGITKCFSCDIESSPLKDSKINVLFKDDANVVWFGSDEGLYYYDLVNDDIKEYSLRINTVNTVINGEDGNIWVGSAEGLINIINGPNGKNKVYRKSNSESSIVANNIKDLAWDSLRKVLWIASNDGISRYIPSENKFFNIRTTPYADSIVENDISEILVAMRSGRLWYTTATEPGINCLSVEFDSESNSPPPANHFEHDPIDGQSIADNNITDFIEDKAGHVWIGTGQNGISFHSFVKSKFTHHRYDQENEWGLKSDKIYSISTMTDGMMWAATGFGLEMLSPDGIREYDYEKSILNVNYIIDVEIVNDENLWVATDQGVIKINTMTDDIIRFSTSDTIPSKRRLSDNLIHDILPINDKVWVATGSGVVIIDTTSNNVTNFSSDLIARVITQDADGDIWLGTEMDGLYKIPYSLFNNIIQGKDFEIEGHIFDPEFPNGISSSQITCISQDKNGMIWIGTNGGLNQYSKQDDTFLHYFVEDGLSSNYVTGIVVDEDNNLWISSKKGISFFDQSDSTFTNYGLEDGIGNIDFHRHSYDFSSDGSIYFGGPLGITKVNPKEIQYNDYVPPCIITKVKKNLFDETSSEIFMVSNDKKSGEKTNSLTIDHRVKSFSIDFASLNYHQSIKNKYRYKLVPFDRDWIYSGGLRFASYNNLGRNTYQFIVQGSNDDGLWSKPEELTIKFIPHPLLSYWAFAIYAVFAGVAIFMFVRYRMHRQKYQLEEERRIKELEEARDFQMSLIPQSPPDHPDYDIALHMKTSTEVGGDYYDFFPQEDGAMYVVCGDATGHGLNAGMMVSITKAGLYGSDFDTPASTTTRLNRTIKAIDLGTTRMSLNMAKLNNGSFDFTSAGMPPAYLYKHESGEVDEILIPGLPLGSMKKADFDLHSFKLNSNDALILISDGLPECVNHEGEMLDYEPVKNCIEANGNKTAQGIMDSLIDLGDDWMSGLMNDDDITLVVIKKK